MLSAAAGCPASGGVPGPRGYVARQSGVLSSVLMSPFLMCAAGYSFLNELRLKTWPFYADFSLFDLPCHWLVGRFGRRG